MKSTLSAIVLATLLVGCGGQESTQQLTPVQKATKDYTAISASMTRDEVYRRLGQPQKKTPEGTEEWRTSSDDGQIAVLTVTFTPDGKVASRDFHVDDAGGFVVQPQ